MLGNFGLLPKEIVSHIIDHLPFTERYPLLFVNSDFKKLLLGPDNWRQITLRGKIGDSPNYCLDIPKLVKFIVANYCNTIEYLNLEYDERLHWTLEKTKLMELIYCPKLTRFALSERCSVSEVLSNQGFSFDDDDDDDFPMPKPTSSSKRPQKFEEPTRFSNIEQLRLPSIQSDILNQVILSCKNLKTLICGMQGSLSVLAHCKALQIVDVSSQLYPLHMIKQHIIDVLPNLQVLCCNTHNMPKRETVRADFGHPNDTDPFGSSFSFGPTSSKSVFGDPAPTPSSSFSIFGATAPVSSSSSFSVFGGPAPVPAPAPVRTTPKPTPIELKIPSNLLFMDFLFSDCSTPQQFAKLGAFLQRFQPSSVTVENLLCHYVMQPDVLMNFMEDYKINPFAGVRNDTPFIPGTRFKRDSLLIRAIYSGNFKLVEYLLAKGANPNRVTQEGHTLHVAIKAGSMPIFELLLKKGADICAVDATGRNALQYATCVPHRLAFVEVICAEAPRLIDMEVDGLNAVSYSVLAGKLENVEYLSRLSKTSDEHSPLLCISIPKATDNTVFHYLLQKNIGVRGVLPKTGDTPLIIACQQNPEVVPLLLENKSIVADINKANAEGWTPLHYACLNIGRATKARKKAATPAPVPSFDIFDNDEIHSQSNLNVILLLMKNGAHLSAVAKDGTTPLLALIGTTTGSHEGMERIIENALGQMPWNSKLNANAQNASGMSLLHAACIQGYTSVVKLLLKNGANPNIVDEKGVTPLIAVCRIVPKGHLEIMTALLEAGALSNAVDKIDGSCALDLVCRVNTEDRDACLALLLSDPKLDVFSRNWLNDTPIHTAAAIGDAPLLEKLLQRCKGAKWNPHGFGDRTPLMRFLAVSKSGSKHTLTLQDFTSLDDPICLPSWLTPSRPVRGPSRVPVPDKGDVISVVLKYHPEWVQIPDYNNNLPIHVALAQAELDLPETFFNLSDLSAKNNEGENAFHLFCRAASVWEKYSLLPQFKSPSVSMLNSTNRTNQTAIAIAANYSLPYWENWIVDGVNVNSQDSFGGCILTGFVSDIPMRRFKTIFGKLKKCGANLDIQNEKGQTPLHIYCSHPAGGVNQIMVGLLLEFGATANIKDKFGKTPLDNWLAFPSFSPDYFRQIQNFMKHGCASDHPMFASFCAVKIPAEIPLSALSQQKPKKQKYGSFTKSKAEKGEEVDEARSFVMELATLSTTGDRPAFPKFGQKK